MKSFRRINGLYTENDKLINVIGDAVSTQTNEPLADIVQGECYYEITILSTLDATTMTSSVIVGYEIERDRNSHLTFMLCNSGDAVGFSGNSQRSDGFGTGDVVGCLWRYLPRENCIRVFFSVNGIVVNHADDFVQPSHGLSVFPTVTLIGVGTSIRVSFDNAPQHLQSTISAAVDLPRVCSRNDVVHVQTTSDMWTEDDSERVKDGLSLLEGVLASYQQSFQYEKAENESMDDNTSAYRDIMINIRDALKSLQSKLLNTIQASEGSVQVELLNLSFELTNSLDATEDLFTQMPTRTSLSPSPVKTEDEQPSMLSLLRTLRRGNRDETFRAVTQLMSICNACWSSGARLNVGDLKNNGILQALLLALQRANAVWPEVELLVSQAIAILAANGDHKELLFKENRESILASLHYLLIRAADAEEWTSELSSQDIRTIVSAAVTRVCLEMCVDWDSDVITCSDDAFTCNPDFAEVDALQHQTSLEFHKSHSASVMTSEQTPPVKQCLDIILNVIRLLCPIKLQSAPPSRPVSIRRPRGLSTERMADPQDHKQTEMHRSTSAPNFATSDLYGILGLSEQSLTVALSETTIDASSSRDIIVTELNEITQHCSVAICNLARVVQFRAALVENNTGVLALLVMWLNACGDEVKRRREQNSQDIPREVHEIINNVCGSLAYLTDFDWSIPTICRSNEVFGQLKHAGSNYTIGRIDAQIIASDVHVAIEKFVNLAAHDFMGSDYSVSEKSKLFLTREASLSICRIICSLASRGQNRPQMILANNHISVLRIFVDAIMQRQYYHVSNLKYECGNMHDDLERIHNDEESEITYLMSLTQASLNALSYFLTDRMSFHISRPASHSAVATNMDVVGCICNGKYLKCLKFCLSHSSGKRLSARLAVLRVISMMVEWHQALHALDNAHIFDDMVLVLKDLLSDMDYVAVPPLPPKRGERTSSHGSTRDDDINSESIRLECTMRTCYSLAHVCQDSIESAIRLFEHELMTVILKAVRCEHVEIQRQALRCISAMCPVLSSIFPGRHPLLVAEKLRSDSTSNTPRTKYSDSSDPAKHIARTVLIFGEALRALVSGLHSPSSLVVRESLKGIAFLALDDHLRVGIIEGPLREIICILVDPMAEPELRILAESVIVNIGFHQGRKDLEIVGNDYSLLAVWFYLKRSLRPQALAYSLLHQWIDTIFHGEEYAEKHARRRFILSELGRDDSQFDGDDGSLSIRFPDGTCIDLRDTLDLPGLSALLDIVAYVTPSHSKTTYRRPSRGVTMQISPETSMREALLIQYAHLYETWKLIRHGLPESARIVPAPQHAPQEEWNSDAKLNTILSSRRRSNNPLDIFFRYLSFCTGRGTAQSVLDEEDSDCGYFRRSDSSYDKELDIGNIFTPPSQVLELLNVFFPSPSYQHFLLDLLSVGDIVQSVDHETRFHYIPTPIQFRGLLLPPRHYLSFKREGRIIERIIEDFIALGTVNSPDHPDQPAKINMKLESSLVGASPNVLWTLCFRDSSFLGEFHHDLLHILRRCPQVSSLNFVNKRPERDSSLGFLAGSVPASIRFLTFESVLNSDGIQLMCVKIRTQNAAYTQHTDTVGGLKGLALRSHNLVGEDVKHICELLDTTLATQVNGVEETLTKSLPRIYAGPKVCMQGLKYLDLSDCHLTDQVCAEILKAAGCGEHLESLELSRNYIGKGVHFTEAFMSIARKNHSLKYLGVSMNTLHNTSFRGILNGCLNNKIRHLDVSGNFLTDTKNNRECVRNFLRTSTSMRVLNLSGNRFTAEMVKTIHLGLLENDTMLLLSLSDNPLSRYSDLHGVHEKLKMNRDRYTNYRTTSEPKSPLTPASLPTSIDGTQDTSMPSLARATTDGSVLYSSENSAKSADNLKNDRIVSAVAVADLSDSYADDLISNVLCVLFSAPLAYSDANNNLHPIQMLDYAGERDILIQVFREAQRNIGLRLDFATTDTLRSAVTLGCRALHYSGHGHPQCLNFEDGRSGLQFVPTKALRDLCQAGGLKLEFVFVSACLSEKAGEAFIEAGVPHVVCVSVDAQILDIAAVAFTRAFYLALAVGSTVAQAFAIGKQAVAASPYVRNSVAEGNKFVLLPVDGNHDIPIFDAAPVRTWPPNKSSLRALRGPLPENVHLPQPPEDFEGREVDMHRVITKLYSKRLVSVIGDRGSGKTAVAAGVCVYLNERGVYDDGIVFVRSQGIVSYESFLFEVSRSLARGPATIASRVLSSAEKFKHNSDLLGKVVPPNDQYDPISEQEEYIVSCIADLKMLMVLDHIDDILNNSSSSDASTDLKMFLGHVFERCRNIKILITSTAPLQLHSFGVVEGKVPLGNLSLLSSIRLFARLTPHLCTAEDRNRFTRSLMVPRQGNLTSLSKDICPAALSILALLGNGHPANIIKFACECNADDVAELEVKGKNLVSNSSACDVSRSPTPL